MGAGASAASLKPNSGTSRDVRKFVECFQELSKLDKKGRANRAQAWRAIDNNGNGYVSLAESGAWVKQSLLDYMPWDPDYSEHLYKKFYPSYIRAHKDAADAGKDREIPGIDASTDDYVQKHEFRIFTAYLCLYALMFDAFQKIDNTDGDEERKFTEEAWKAGYMNFVGSPFYALSACGTSEPLANIAFSEMDADGKGAVLLIEFCTWIKNKEIAMQTEVGKILDAGHKGK